MPFEEWLEVQTASPSSSILRLHFGMIILIAS